MNATAQAQQSPILNKIQNSPFNVIRAMASSDGWSMMVKGYALYALQSSITEEHFLASVASKLYAIVILFAFYVFIVDTIYVIAYPIVLLYYTFKKDEIHRT